MKYFEEFGKKLTYPHCIKITGDKVWDIFQFDPAPFSNWLSEPVNTWLNDLEPMKKYPKLPLWFPGNEMMPAWKAGRPYKVLTCVIKPRDGHPAGYEANDVANIRFFRKEDAMKFKLTWS